MRPLRITNSSADLPLTTISCPFLPTDSGRGRGRMTTEVWTDREIGYFGEEIQANFWVLQIGQRNSPRAHPQAYGNISQGVRPAVKRLHPLYNLHELLGPILILARVGKKQEKNRTQAPLHSAKTGRGKPQIWQKS